MNPLILSLILVMTPLVAFAGQDCWQLSQGGARISDGATCTCNDGHLRCVFKEDPQDAKPNANITGCCNHYAKELCEGIPPCEDAKPKDCPWIVEEGTKRGTFKDGQVIRCKDGELTQTMEDAKQEENKITYSGEPLIFELKTTEYREKCEEYIKAMDNPMTSPENMKVYAPFATAFCTRAVLEMMEGE